MTSRKYYKNLLVKKSCPVGHIDGQINCIANFTIVTKPIICSQHSKLYLFYIRIGSNKYVKIIQGSREICGSVNTWALKIGGFSF